jgi:hypothetical protein
MERKRLIRVLIILAIAVPLLVEGLTFLGLVGSHFGGSDEADTATGTTTPDPVTTGDELLTETNQTETLSSAFLQSGGDRWTLTLTVTVDNTGGSPYELQLGTVTLNDGKRVDGASTTGKIDPGQTGTVTGTWKVPAGSTPETLAVTVIEYGDDGANATTTTVNIGGIPVRG